MSPLGAIGAIGDHNLCAHAYVDWPRHADERLYLRQEKDLHRLSVRP